LYLNWPSLHPSESFSVHQSSNILPDDGDGGGGGDDDDDNFFIIISDAYTS
jgi:hypothetical protein